MSHWLEPLLKIAECQSEELRDLAEAVGLDPRGMYASVDLSECDLRGQDLRGMDLSGTDIASAKTDDRTRMDEIFDNRYDRSYQDGFHLNSKLLPYVKAYARWAGYKISRYAYRDLIIRGANYIEAEVRGRVRPMVYRYMEDNPHLRRIVRPGVEEVTSVNITFGPFFWKRLAFGLDNFRRMPGDPVNVLLLSGLIYARCLSTRRTMWADMSLDQLLRPLKSPPSVVRVRGVRVRAGQGSPR